MKGKHMDTKKTLINRAATETFSDDFIEELMFAKDIDVFTAAVKRKDCHPTLLITYSHTTNETLRIAIAKHNNTPDHVLKDLLNRDKSEKVREAARKNLEAR